MVKWLITGRMKTLSPAPTACRQNIPLASSVYRPGVLQSREVSDIARSRISFRHASPTLRQANETRLASVANWWQSRLRSSENPWRKMPRKEKELQTERGHWSSFYRMARAERHRRLQVGYRPRNISLTLQIWLNYDGLHFYFMSLSQRVW